MNGNFSFYLSGIVNIKQFQYCALEARGGLRRFPRFSLHFFHHLSSIHFNARGDIGMGECWKFFFIKLILKWRFRSPLAGGALKEVIAIRTFVTQLQLFSIITLTFPGTQLSYLISSMTICTASIRMRLMIWICFWRMIAWVESNTQWLGEFEGWTCEVKRVGKSFYEKFL